MSVGEVGVQRRGIPEQSQRRLVAVGLVARVREQGEPRHEPLFEHADLAVEDQGAGAKA